MSPSPEKGAGELNASYGEIDGEMASHPTPDGELITCERCRVLEEEIIDEREIGGAARAERDKLEKQNADGIGVDDLTAMTVRAVKAQGIRDALDAAFSKEEGS